MEGEQEGEEEEERDEEWPQSGQSRFNTSGREASVTEETLGWGGRHSPILLRTVGQPAEADSRGRSIRNLAGSRQGRSQGPEPPGLHPIPCQGT